MTNIKCRRSWILLTFLFIVTLLPYLHTMGFGLVNMDDYAYIASDIRIRELFSLEFLEFALTDVRQGIWMPITWLSYAVDLALFGEWWGGFHLHSVLTHAINACLVWIFLRNLFESKTSKDEFLCLIGAFFWAVHPLRCESVAFLASRKDVLSLFWELLALICWLKGSRSSGTCQVNLTFSSLVCFVLGAMCKPSVMTFPALCLLIDAFVVRRIDSERYLKPLVIALVLALFAGWQQRMGGATQAGSNETVVMRLADGISAFGIYIYKTFIPTQLAVQCIKIWPEWPRFIFGGTVIFIAFIIFFVLRILKYVVHRLEILNIAWRGRFPARITLATNRDYVLAGMLWFFIAVFPMLGFKPFGYHAFADRFTYIPAIGITIVMVAVLKKILCKSMFWKSGLVVLLISVCSVLGFLTWQQTSFWENDEKAFSHALEVTGDNNPVAHLSLAKWYFECAHNLDKSAWHFNRAYAISPSWMGDGYVTYIFALNELGRTDQAAKMLEAFLEDILSNYTDDQKSSFWQGNGPDSIMKMRRQYDYASLSCWIASDKDRHQAIEWMSEHRFECDRDVILKYLKWQLAIRCSDNETEGECFRFLSTPRPIKGYCNFRWLWK